MYSLCIIDDEAAVVEGLRSALPWNEYDIEVVGWEFGGREGYEMLERLKPDLAIVDIRMPGMSGLQLMQKAQSEGLGCVFIIFTAHSEFAYAKQAVALEAVEYLIKPVNPAEILRALQRAVERCQQKRHLLQYGALVDRIHLLSMITASHIADEVADDDRQYAVLAIRNPEDIWPDVLVAGMEERIQAWNTDSSPVHYLSYLHQGTFLVVCCFHRDQRIESRQVHSLVTERAVEIGRFFSHQFRMGVGKPVQGIRQVSVSHEQALEAVTFALYMRRSLVAISEVAYSNDASFPEVPVDLASQIISDSDRHDALAVIEAVVEHGVNRRIHPETLKRYLASVLNELREQIHDEFPGRPPVEMPYSIDEMDTKKLRGLEDPGQISSYFAQRVQDLQWFLKERKTNYKCLVVRRIQEYVHSTLPSPVTLSQIADLVGMNPSYVSRLFKQTTGMNLTEHVAEMRLQRARDLLRGSSLRIYAIAKEAGFDNQRYFSRVFKKHHGMTPGEYRSRFHTT